MTLFATMRMLALYLPKIRRVSGPTRSVLLAACILMASAWIPCHVEAQEAALPVAEQWALYDKILAFDRLFSDRQSDGLVVAVLYQNRFRPSQLASEELQEIGERDGLRLAGKVLRLLPIEYTTIRELESRLVAEGVDCVYIAPLRAVPVAEIAEISARHEIVTLTGVREYVDLGVAVGLGIRGDRPEILVNLDASRQQGMELNAQLLRIATVLTNPHD